MAVTEQQRHKILAWFEEQMGHDLGASMMELLPPADASQLATKADLAEIRADVHAEVAAVRADLATVRADVKADLLQLQRTFGTWLFASQAAVIAVVGVVTALG